MSREPDRYQWFKQHHGHEDDMRRLNLSRSIGHGRVLNLDKISSPTQAGWYICCLLYSQLSVHERKELIGQKLVDEYEYSSDGVDSAQFIHVCSSAELELHLPPKSSRLNVKILLITGAVFSFVIFIMSIVTYCCYVKMKTHKNARQAMSAMQDVSLNLFEPTLTRLNGKKVDYFLPIGTRFI